MHGSEAKSKALCSMGLCARVHPKRKRPPRQGSRVLPAHLSFTCGQEDSEASPPATLIRSKFIHLSEPSSLVCE